MDELQLTSEDCHISPRPNQSVHWLHSTAPVHLHLAATQHCGQQVKTVYLHPCASGMTFIYPNTEASNVAFRTNFNAGDSGECLVSCPWIKVNSVLENP